MGGGEPDTGADAVVLGAGAGTPSAAGTANFTVEVTDSAGTKASRALSIVVNAAALSVSTTSLPNATVGTAYSQTLAAMGGTGGYTWAVTSGCRWRSRGR